MTVVDLVKACFYPNKKCFRVIPGTSEYYNIHRPAEPVVKLFRQIVFALDGHIPDDMFRLCLAAGKNTVFIIAEILVGISVCQPEHTGHRLAQAVFSAVSKVEKKSRWPRGKNRKIPRL